MLMYWIKRASPLGLPWLIAGGKTVVPATATTAVRRASTPTRIMAALMAVSLLLSGCSLLGNSGVNAATPAPAVTPTAVAARVPSFSHIFLIMMENKNYGQVIGSADAPFINGLAAKYGLAANYYGVTHPSLPNYLAITSGSTQNMRYDCEDCSFSSTNLVDQLEQHGKTWKAYVADVPQPCFNGTTAGRSANGTDLYARKHNPLMYYKDVSGDPGRCKNVIPLSGFTPDLQKNSLPNFVWITPNLVDDMHNGTVRQGDDWLASFVPQILASPAWKDGGVLFVVWDEADSGEEGCCTASEGGGHTVALVVAPNGKPGFKSEVPHNHYSVLRTIEEAWGLGFLGHSGDTGVQAMGEFLK